MDLKNFSSNNLQTAQTPINSNAFPPDRKGLPLKMNSSCHLSIAKFLLFLIDPTAENLASLMNSSSTRGDYHLMSFLNDREYQLLR